MSQGYKNGCEVKKEEKKLEELRLKKKKTDQNPEIFSNKIA